MAPVAAPTSQKFSNRAALLNTSPAPNMAPNRGQNRSAEFEELVPGHNDFDSDPEADDISGKESDLSDALSGVEAEDTAREHYVDVGKSKLRKPKDAPLGPQYRGSRVARDAVEEDEETDDPFNRGFDEGESEDEDAGVRLGASSEDDEDDDDDDDDDGEGTPGTEVSDEGEVTARLHASALQPGRRDEIRLAMRDAPKVAESLAQSAQADIEKGRAVKKQRTAFDGLLGARMKLQKALIGANTIVALPTGDLAHQREQAGDAISAAETAAFNLWSTLNDFREELTAARTGEKRKRSFSVQTPTRDLWAHMQDQESGNIERRNATLQKWSKKTQEGRELAQRSKLNNTAPQSTVLDVIQQHVSDMPRLLKRAHTPRSCAPIQLANRVGEDEHIYDDADFYGLMLKELLEAKSADSAAASNIDLSFQMRREAKTRKNVDTKASKGRKLRYTVHEKLQNFMAPEDRRTWSERQANELFGSLFGQRLDLAEDEREDEEMTSDAEMGKEEALMLFRS